MIRENDPKVEKWYEMSQLEAAIIAPFISALLFTIVFLLLCMLGVIGR